MNLPLVVYLAFLAAVLYAALRRPLWLVFCWPIVLIDLPSLRGLPGGVPLYLHSGTTVALCLVVLRDARWPQVVPVLPWYWAFFSVGILFGVLVPALRFGALLECTYLFVQQAISWAALPVGAWVIASRDTTLAFARGALVALVVLAALAVAQRGNPTLGEFIQAFYHRDVRPSAMAAYEGYSDEFLAEMVLHRAFAPFQSATTLSGIAVLMGLASAVTWRHEQPRWAWCSVAMAAIVVAMTVSRHAVAVILLGGLVLLLTAPTRARLKTLAALAGAGLLLLQFEAVTGVWQRRMQAWEHGVLADKNVSARVIDGPLRFWEYVSSDLVALFLGSGIEPHKLSQHGVQIDYSVLEGFVSNGFLLYWYGFGVLGFALFLSFWLWVLARSVSKSNEDRPYAVSAAVVVMGIIAADNYPYIDEVAVTLVFLMAGILAYWRSERPTGHSDPGPPSEPAART